MNIDNSNKNPSCSVPLRCIRYGETFSQMSGGALLMKIRHIGCNNEGLGYFIDVRTGVEYERSGAEAVRREKVKVVYI